MKKIICIICAIILSCVMFAGCGNHRVFDTTYTYDYAIIQLPDGEVVKGKVENWSDYEGDQIQVRIDGRYYLVHSNNIALISE